MDQRADIEKQGEPKEIWPSAQSGVTKPLCSICLFRNPIKQRGGRAPLWLYMRSPSAKNWLIGRLIRVYSYSLALKHIQLVEQGARPLSAAVSYINLAKRIKRALEKSAAH